MKMKLNSGKGYKLAIIIFLLMMAIFSSFDLIMNYTASDHSLLDEGKVNKSEMISGENL